MFESTAPHSAAMMKKPDIFAHEHMSADATITANGALIYNSSTTAGSANRAVVVLAFGGDKSSSAGDFTITFPAADASNAIIRIA